MIDIYGPDEFFGEAGFLGLPQCYEQALSLHKTLLMAWQISEVEDLAMKQPALAMALMQVVLKRSTEFKDRIQSFIVDNIDRRLARVLLQLSYRWSVEEDNGTIRLREFTHELLSRYIGTSREQVTTSMNRFRRDGYLKYSRKGIVMDRGALAEWLRDDYRERYLNGRAKSLSSAPPTEDSIED